ncbi:ATP-binding cassette domain-containing protein [Leucobacter salsicius]|uniref:ATP-binding cassette domain-containing protein n=1 Tax=Leucobacter salsicius TaxID=664638 RepID=UPI0003493AD9|nr:ABC transporter ATP-binding protein [Leucobacter salsicius]
MHTSTPTDSQPQLAPNLAAERQEPFLRIHALEVDGPRGRVFGPISAESSSPVTVVLGASGSGRTSLLLTIAGRMRASRGGLETLGEAGTGAIRSTTGIAGFAGIDDLEPAVTLAATLRERLSWELAWWRRTPRVTEAVASELLAPAFGVVRNANRISQPDTALLCRELSPADDLLVRIALALIARPELLVIDDLDALRDPEHRERVADRVREIATHTPVVIATSDPRDVALFGAPSVINL